MNEGGHELNSGKITIAVEKALLHWETNLYQFSCAMQRHSGRLPHSLSQASLRSAIGKAVERTPIDDIHTHLYDPAFGELLLWGIDELLTYHYLVAEFFRYHPIDCDKFWSLPKAGQADLIWEHLFIQNSPVSESCRGVLTCLTRLGIDLKKRNLALIRKHFKSWSCDRYTDHVLRLANVERVIMTNNPFDDLERPVWEKGWRRDGRFEAALRLDDLLLHWKRAVPRLRAWGYAVAPEINHRAIEETRRFLRDWIRRFQPVYMAVSLPPSFSFPEPLPGPDRATVSRLLADVILPECREHGLPFAMMIGVKKLTNPRLKLAGDSVGRADVGVVERMCRDWPANRFLVTMLARENQHELCVAARKFRNLHVFGCWWFLNNPSIIEEMTRERIEMLGLSFTPQHSDARVLDQLLYKWDHFREVLTPILEEKYQAIRQRGWPVTSADIERDVKSLFGGAFRSFLKS